MTLHSLDFVRAAEARHRIVLKNSGVEELSLTSFAGSRTTHPDIVVDSGISSKLTCFAVALMMNGLIFAGVNYLFISDSHRDSTRISLAYTNGAAVAHNAR
jgi:hypothetical protein